MVLANVIKSGGINSTDKKGLVRHLPIPDKKDHSLVFSTISADILIQRLV
jgi:hypothetical protein